MSAVNKILKQLIVFTKDKKKSNENESKSKTIELTQKTHQGF